MGLPFLQFADPITISTSSSVAGLSFNRSDLVNTITLTQSSANNLSLSGAITTAYDVADANPAFTANLVNASSTGRIALFQFGGVTKASITQGGNFYGIGIANLTTSNNAYVQTISTGTIVSRNVADANPSLIVDQIHASSTGKILDLRFGGTTKFSVDSTSTTLGDGSSASALYLILNGAVSQNKRIEFRSNNVTKWRMYTNGTESGSDAGMNFQLEALTDAGASIDTPLSIARASGGNITLARPLSGTSATFSSYVSIARTVASSFLQIRNDSSSLRWTMIGLNAESTGNAGYDFVIRRYADDGSTFLGNALTITRSTSNATFSGDVTAASFIKSGGTSSQFLKADGSTDSSTYLTANQSISLSGDASGSGTTSITVALSDTGVTDALLTNYTVGTNTALAATDSILAAMGKIQGQLNNKQASGSYLTANQSITLSGDASGSGATAITVALSDTGVTDALLTNYAVGTNTALAATDSILVAMGKIQGQLNNKQASGSYLTGTKVDSFNTRTGAVTLSSSDVTTALTYTPYNATNPNNYIALSAVTDSVVTGKVLTGYSVGTNTALAATDTILAAMGKIQGQLNNKQASGSYLTANQSITLSGDASGSGTTAITVALSDTGVTDALLTNYSVGTNTALAATDSILVAMGKIQGQLNNKQASGSYLTGTKVDSFNTRTGAVTLTSSDVTTALTYTPYNSTNPSGYISGTDVNIMTGRGTVAEASIDTAISNGYYTINRTGDSCALLTFNVGGSSGPTQIYTDYQGVLKFRNKTDSATWTGWKTVYHTGNLGALGTGILKNTTSTGVLSIAVAGDFPTLNQNTTGSAATLTTSRTINGTGFNGSANITVPVNSTDITTAGTYYPLFTSAAGNTQASITTTKLTFNPSTGAFNSTLFEAIGSGTGGGIILRNPSGTRYRLSVNASNQLQLDAI